MEPVAVSKVSQLRKDVEECLGTLIPKNPSDSEILMFSVMGCDDGVDIRIRVCPDTSLYTKLMRIETLEGYTALTIWFTVNTDSIFKAQKNIEKLAKLRDRLSYLNVKEIQTPNPAEFALQFSLIHENVISTVEAALRSMFILAK